MANIRSMTLTPSSMTAWTKICGEDDVPIDYWQKDGTSDQADIHGMLHVVGKSACQFGTGYN